MYIWKNISSQSSVEVQRTLTDDLKQGILDIKTSNLAKNRSSFSTESDFSQATWAIGFKFSDNLALYRNLKPKCGRISTVEIGVARLAVFPHFFWQTTTSLKPHGRLGSNYCPRGLVIEILSRISTTETHF